MSYQNFIARDNITKLYKKISKKYQLKNKSKNEKQEILDILMKNMKKVYKSLDYDKINDRNLKKVEMQYNNLCIEETENEINKIDNEDSSNNISQLKFKRDFHSKPSKRVSFMNRPTFTKVSKKRVSK